MRRLMAVATFVLTLALLCAQAQRGGGGHGGFSGGHGGVASHGSFGGHAGPMHAFSGRGFSGAPRIGGSRGFSPNATFHQRGFVRPGFRNGVRFRTFNGNCFGCRRFISPLWSYGYDPYWWYDNDYSYDYQREQEIGLANEMNQQNLAEQNYYHQQDQDAYARPPRMSDRSSDRNSDPPLRGDVQAQSFEPKTVLVFRDKHQQEVQNYAIVGDVLWAFAPLRQKIELDDLDIPATQKANDDRGVDFRVPNDGKSDGRISIGVSYQ